MSPREIFALRDYLDPQLKGRSLSDARQVVQLTEFAGETCLEGQARRAFPVGLVLLAVADQLVSALAILEMDGVARRMLLCPPDLAADHISTLVEDAGIDAVVTDRPAQWAGVNGIKLVVSAQAPMRAAFPRRQTERATEWLMLTSGTSGVPKIVGHTLEGLTGAIVADGPARGASPVWATFYDIRRYSGGLQIIPARHHRRRFLIGAVGAGESRSPITWHGCARNQSRTFQVRRRTGASFS